MPTPPGPVRVSSRTSDRRSRATTWARSALRPSSRVNGMGRGDGGAKIEPWTALPGWDKEWGSLEATSCFRRSSPTRPESAWAA
ncbi:MAG TPA: hypothetical protein VFA10_20170 [Ktedonobacteraceae bacterium]|nr:hypothetical protein [Ktedonobacteraceae bacterium]